MTKSSRARLRARTYAASAPLKRVLSGTSTAPAETAPERGDDPVQGVGRPDGDPVAGLDAGGDAGGRGALDALAELRVTDAGAAVDDGLARRRRTAAAADPRPAPAMLPHSQVPARRRASRPSAPPATPVADYPSD